MTYEPRSRLLRLAAAGHHPAVRLASGAELTAERTGGIDRLSALLRERAQLAPQDTLEMLKRDLRKFAGERLTDDVCPAR